MTFKEYYNREKLIKICEKAIVDISKWSNRDSPSAQINIGKCWALLKAGCEYNLSYNMLFEIIDLLEFEESETENHITFKLDFNAKEFENETICYFPSESLLKKNIEKDWY